MAPYPHLFTPISLGPVEIKNRIFSPAHGTTLGCDGRVTPDLIAYHEARAQGGTGLIVLEGMTLHESYGFPEAFLYAGDDAIVPGLAELARACQGHGCRVVGQLFHAGRAVRMSHDGSRPVTYSASDSPDERYRVVPRAMTTAMVWEIIEAYGAAGRRLADGGLDGVEVLASMGYLISQFLNSRTNHRDDEFGGSFDNRLRLLRETLLRLRERIGRDRVLGMRISADEFTEDGLDSGDVIEICRAIDGEGLVDYVNVIAGSSASPAGWVHVFPSMAMGHGYVAPLARTIKEAVSVPVLVAGRVNQPQTAEQILNDGDADMVGMARALICDPDFAAKAGSGRGDDIRACIGCNQACVGHRLAHHKISCIQNPVTGRELQYGNHGAAERSRRVMVIGGGVGGMKAAAVAAGRGHEVTLCEKSRALGGQALLAQLLPGRSEFGGIVTNLVREVDASGADMRTGTEATLETAREIDPDAIILATGASPRQPAADRIDGAHVVDAWAVIDGRANVGASVVVADWRCDWIGLGVAEKLARDGCRVRLMVSGIVPGEMIQGIVRDQWIGELHKLGVEMVPYMRFHGADADSAYFQHQINGEAVVCDEVDTVVTCSASRAEDHLLRDLETLGVPVYPVGDCVSPRTAEEAVLDGLKAAWAL